MLKTLYKSFINYNIKNFIFNSLMNYFMFNGSELFVINNIKTKQKRNNFCFPHKKIKDVENQLLIST